MEGRYPKGILFLLSNCKDPSLDLDFNYWYSNVYLPHLMASGTFQQATRYRNTEHRSKTSDAEYMAILETDSEDLYGAMGDFKERAKKLANKHGMHMALEEVVAAVFRATGPEFRAGPEARNSTGSMLLLSNCKDESNEREFNHWYDTVHIPHVIESGRYHTAYRYESIDPRPTPRQVHCDLRDGQRRPRKTRRIHGQRATPVDRERSLFSRHRASDARLLFADITESEATTQAFVYLRLMGQASRVAI